MTNEMKKELESNIRFIKNNLNHCPSQAKANIVISIEKIVDVINRLDKKCEESVSKKKSPQDNNINGNLTKANVYTLERLKNYYNGRGGRPLYIAVNNIVYNITLAKNWGGGSFMGMNQGEDLSDYFNSHPKEYEILKKKAVKVGILEKD